MFHSVAGMNDEEVLKCEAVKNIQKEVRLKYRELGKKCTLETLCGNIYYRKEMTAIKFIQAKKILEKWRLLKAKQKRRSKILASQVSQRAKSQVTENMLENNQ